MKVTFTVVKQLKQLQGSPENNPGFKGNRTHDLRDTGATL